MGRERVPAEPTDIREEGLEALNAIANEHRIRILRTLAEADDPLPFSELRRRVGMRDTGQFNYHLTELVGRFVRQTESGYELGRAGERVVLATASVDAESAAMGAATPRDEECPVCGEHDCKKVIHVHFSGR